MRQGLADVLAFAGGVPRGLAFDNATEVGGRVGGVVRTSEPFALLVAHHGLDHSLASPCSGNERGNVEDEAGATRRDPFVPVPAARDAEASNRQGTVTVGGPHRYSAGPALAGRSPSVALRAFRVDTVDPSTGEVAASYGREWGDGPTGSADPALQPGLLCLGPGGWGDSRVRASLPGAPVAFLDSGPRDPLAADLRALRDACAEVGWAAAVAAPGDGRVAYDEPVGLGACDAAFRLVEGGVAAMPPSAAQRDAAHARFRSAARAPFLSNATVEDYVATATAGQLASATAMLGGGLARRGSPKGARLLRQARLPVPKSFEGYDWSHVSFPEGWGREGMLSLAFVGASGDLVLHGPTGRGRTHCATALGMLAVARGVPAGSWQTAALVMRLGKARREGSLDRLLADLGRAELLVPDEFGYVPLDVDGARLPCQVVADSHERRSVVLTTNVGSGRWGTVLADDRLAAAMVDRVVHHGRLVESGGPSHRLENSLMLGRGPA